MYVIRLVVALVLCEDHTNFCMGGQSPQPKGIGMHQLPYQIGDGGDMCEVVKAFDWGCFKNAHHLMYALVLGNLHLGQEALLVNTSVSSLGAIG